MTEPPADKNKDTWLESLGKFVTGRPVQILIVGGLLALIAVPEAAQLPSACNARAGPARGTLGSKSRQVFQEKFPGSIRIDPYQGVVALRSPEKKQEEEEEDQRQQQQQQNALIEEVPSCRFENVECTQRYRLGGAWPTLLRGVQEAIMRVVPPSSMNSKQEAPVLSLPGILNFSYGLNESLNQLHAIEGYSSNATMWYEQGVPASMSFVSRDGTATLIAFGLKADPKKHLMANFASDAEDVWYREVRKWLPTDKVETGLSSVTLVMSSAVEDSKRSMMLMICVALPLASLVLWYLLGSTRLLLFPLLTTISSALIGFGLMFLCAEAAGASPTTPTMMMSLTIAMCIDYSLFFLTRFRQELIALGMSGDEPDIKVQNAIHKTMPTAGFVILLSGSILCSSFIVMIMFPLTTLSSMGLGCSLSLVIAVIVHLTMGPALLAAFPVFFSGCVPQEDASVPARQPTPAAAMMGRWSAPRSGTARLFSTLASFTARPGAGALTVLLVATATCVVGHAGMDMQTSSDFKMLMPRHSNAYHSFDLMERKFGGGHLLAIAVLMEVDGHHVSVLEQKPWEDSQRVLQAMVDELPFMDDASITAPSYNLSPEGVTANPWLELGGCLAMILAPPPECMLMMGLTLGLTSEDRRAMMAVISLEIDPAGARGKKFIKKSRELLDRLEPTTALKFTMAGGAIETHDNIDLVMNLFPVMVSVTLLVALVMLGVAFRSVVIPLRSITSIALTLLWVYGCAVRVYQYGALNWLGWHALEGTLGAQYWLMPVTAFSIVVGLCLDYDIFLLTRVTECREQGMTTQEAVEEALCSTGETITAAGLIMTIAFSGLLFSEVAAVNTLGFYMVWAVLYDTVVVRCFVVPATMAFAGRWNWWPSVLSSGKD